MRETSELREALAAYAHDAWSGWMNYLLSKSTVNDDGTWTVPKWAAERWYRQMSTPYHLLPEDEKTSDRAEADKMLAIVAHSPYDSAIEHYYRSRAAGARITLKQAAEQAGLSYTALRQHKVQYDAAGKWGSKHRAHP